MGQLFQQPFTDHEFLIISHRGFWGGNIVENTRQSAQLAVKAGADIVEVDVCRSKDGTYYLFHDGNENKLLGLGTPFFDLSASNIDKVSALNTLSNPSGFHIEKLSDFLAWLPREYLVNLDRSWLYWEDDGFFDLLKASGKTNQLLLKSPVEKAYLKQLKASGAPLAYMPIIHELADLDTLVTFQPDNLVGVELVVKEETSDLLSPDLMHEFKKHGLFVMANTETLGKDKPLFAGLDDDKALLDGYDSSWGRLLELGVTVIQTDWPNFLFDYRQSRVGESKPNKPEKSQFEDYTGPVDPSVLRPLMGASLNHPPFVEIVDQLNRWQVKTAIGRLETMVTTEESTEIQVQALYLLAEIYFTYEAHSESLAVVEQVLARNPRDVFALTLGYISAKANRDVHQATSYFTRLQETDSASASQLKADVTYIEKHLAYDAVVTDLNQVTELDAIAVYGYGLSPQGDIPSVLELRLIQTIDVAKAFPEAKIIVSGGAVSTPYIEARAMKEYLVDHGLEPKRIIEEPYAKDTVGNSLMTADIIHDHQFSSVCVVTSLTHLPRAWLSFKASLSRIDRPVTLYGAAYEHGEPGMEVLAKEVQLAYSTTMRSAGLFNHRLYGNEENNGINF